MELFVSLKMIAQSWLKRLVKRKMTFDELFDEFLSERKIGEGRRRHYEVLKRMLHRYSYYLEHCRLQRKTYVFDVTKMTVSLLEGFSEYVLNEAEYVKIYPAILERYPEERQIRPRCENYLCGVMKELRAFCNWLCKKGLMCSSPFEGFQMPDELYGTPVYLTLREVESIYHADFSDDPRLEIQRDIFVFQCNVGCRVGDLLRLKKNNVVNGCLEYIPSKTIRKSSKTVVVPLNDVASAIVKKYQTVPGNRLFPFTSSQIYNICIKKVLERSEINRMVTRYDPLSHQEIAVPINKVASSHMARRTFIGNIYRQVKDPSLVSSLTGHVDGSEAFCRYREIDLQMKKELVRLLHFDTGVH